MVQDRYGQRRASDIFKSELGQPTTPEMVDAALSTGKYDTICITHNETSTGIQNPVEEIAEVLKNTRMSCGAWTP